MTHPLHSFEERHAHDDGDNTTVSNDTGSVSPDPAYGMVVNASTATFKRVYCDMT